MKLLSIPTAILLSLSILFSSVSLKAGEGMWLPQLLKALNESEMKDLGFELTAEDIYSINKGSLKDAIVHFGGFCTSEIISSKGLLLTNHHCGYGQLQSHTTLENNYIENGFWAMTMKEELANPGLSAIMIKRIDNITESILKGISEDLNPKERQSLIDASIANFKKSLKLNPFESAQVKAFFKGNQYYQITTVSYPDVRLVGSPPTAVGKFGSDTDNWVWPRHTGDFMLFRIYANENNEPSEYNTSNVPFAPKKHLEISTKEVKEGDFTMVFGFPGSTNEYLPSHAIEQIVNDLNPKKIAIRDAALKIIDIEMKSDPQVKIQYASKFARVANYWKKWIGESQGLTVSNAVADKKQFEADFTQRLKKKPALNEKYGSLITDFRKLYGELKPYAVAHDIFFETFYRNIELGQLVYLSDRCKQNAGQGKEAFNNYKGRIANHFSNFHKNYVANIDKKVFKKLVEMYIAECPKEFLPKDVDASNIDLIAEDIYTNTLFTDKSKFDALYSIDDPQAFIEQLENDPAYKYMKPFMKAYFDNANGPYEKFQTDISDKMRHYMRLQMELFPEKRFYPDANSTMRVTYGQVKSYKPRDAVKYEAHTYLEGVIEKHVPGDYEFEAPSKLIELYNKKDYGNYAAANGKLPVCFIGTNHTTGGNSGSPVLDSKGRLIGLNFDRAWEGTMSDYNYDKDICRNIMVDVRFILFMIDKYAGATHLIKEMDIVGL